MKLFSTLIALGISAGVSLFAADSTAPQVVSTASLDKLSVGVCFNEAVDPTTANDTTKYTLSGGANVISAELQTDGTTVLLMIDGLTGSSYNLTVNGVTDLAGNAANATVAGTVLGFTAADLGVVEAPGKAIACGPGAVDVYARGADIWGTADSGHFVWEEKTGDFDVRVRLESFTAPSVSANAGLMARETPDAGSRNVQIVTYSNQKIWVSAERPETDGASRVLGGNWSVDWPTNSTYPNVWLRLKRVQNTFTTYGSTNGVDWLQVGDSVTPENPYPDAVLVGMRTTPVEVQVAGSTAAVKYRDYGNYAITNATISISQQPANTTIRENTTATFTVSAEVTGTSASNLSYQWQKDGVNIPGATSANYTTPVLTQADNNGKYRVLVSLPGGLVTKLSDEASVSVVQDSIPPQLLSLSSMDGTTIGIRFDELLGADTASDPSKYSVSGASVDSATLEVDGKSVTLGISGLVGTNFTLTVNGVTDLVGNSASTNANGTVMGIVPQDIGTMIDIGGRAVSFEPAGVDVWARGLDIWGVADSGHFEWKEQTGDFDVRVRLQSFTAPAPDASAGLMAREDLSEGSRNIGIVVYANQKNWTATQRAETDGASSVLPGNWRINWPEGAAYPNIWVRLKRVGNTFTTYGSTNGTVWTQIGDSVTPEVAYPDSLLVCMRTSPVEVEVPGSTAFAQYRDFGRFALSNVSINITQQPVNFTVLENRSATFSMDAVAVGTDSSNLSFQWQRDGVDIPGATGKTYTIQSASSADAGAKFRVKVSLPGDVSAFSDEALLTVTEDTTAPAILSAGGMNNGVVAIQFDEALDSTTANDASHYTIAGTDVFSAALQPDAKTVVLTLSALSGTSFQVNIAGVTDLAGNAINGSATGQVSPFQFTDIGTVPEPSSGFTTGPGSFDVASRGIDIWGTADSGNFIWEERTGDFDVRVRLQSFQAAAVSANAGLMAREDLGEGSRNISIVTYANQALWVSTERPEADGPSVVTTGDWDVAWPAGAAYPNIWLRLERDGNTFTMYGGTNGVDWVQVGDSVTPSTPYPATILVGMRTTPVEVQVPGSTGYAQYRDYGDFVQTVVPEISITKSANQITLSWPAAGADGFKLETTTALGGTWSEATTSTTTEGGMIKATLPIEAAGARFFRLTR